MLRVEVLYRQGNVVAARELAKRYIATYSDLHAERMREIAATDEPR